VFNNNVGALVGAFLIAVTCSSVRGILSEKFMFLSGFTNLV